MRRGEILDLMWKDVNFKHGFIHVRKAKNSMPRNIPIDQHLYEILNQLYLEQRNREYVFVNSKGRKLKCIKEGFKNTCKRAGLDDLWFHDLRHTAASLLASGGCDIITLKNILGHKTLAMTQRYAHLKPDKHEKTRQIMSHFLGQIRYTKSNTVGSNLEMKL
jgi:integrase